MSLVKLHVLNIGTDGLAIWPVVCSAVALASPSFSQLSIEGLAHTAGPGARCAIISG